MTDNGRQNAAKQALRISAFKPAILAILLGVSGASATLPNIAMAQSYSFSSVQIEGLGRIQASSVMTYLGIGKGEAISAAELNDAYQRVVASGLFEKVELTPRGGTLVVKVTEYPTISRINVEGNKRLKDEDLLVLLTSQPRYVFNPATAERDAQTLTEAYQADGRLAATVSPRIIRRPQNTVDLVFEVVEGKNSEIERISFNGNRAYSDARLRRVIESKQAGLLRFFISTDTFDPARVEFDKQLLRDFYTSRGYIDIDVVSAASEVPATQDGYIVNYEVREGQQYSLGALSTVSEVDGLDPAEFQDEMQLREGTTYSPQVIERAIARMEKLAQQKGMGFVRVDPRVTRNERDGTLDIEFAVVRGPRVVVERIDIEGNATTLDRVVRQQFTTVEGDPFNPRAIRAAAERIRALGYFSNVDVQAREGSAPDAVVVDVDVEEQGTGAFSFGATYAMGAGLGISASFSESNFLGRGQYLKLEYSGSFDDANYSVAFAEPNLFGRDLRLSFNGGYTTATYADNVFNVREASGSIGLDFPVSELGRFSVKGGGNAAIIEDYASGAGGMTVGDSPVLLAEEARGWQYGAFAGVGYTFDTRRNGLDQPINGFFRVNAEVGGFGSDNTYVKATGLGNVTSSLLGNESIELSATVEGGAIVSVGGGAGTRITDRFLIAPDQLLGFSSLGMGPRDVAATNDDALGGNFYSIARVEAKFPLGLPEEYGIRGGVFGHVGSVWGLDNPLGVDDGFHLRASVGAAVHWDTPIGPLRFSYAIPVERQSYDVVSRFGVSISTGF